MSSALEKQQEAAAEKEPAWWQKFLTMEPALARGIAGFLVLVAANVGVHAETQIEAGLTIFLALLSLVPLIQAWWTRPAVTANGKVVAVVEPDGQVAAGPASTVADGQLVVVTEVEAHDPTKVDNADPHPYDDF